MRYTILLSLFLPAFHAGAQYPADNENTQLFFRKIFVKRLKQIRDSMYAKNLNESNDLYAWGLAGGQAQIVTGIVTLAGGFIAFYLSFNFLLIIMGIIQVIATIIQARMLFARNA